MKRHQIVFLFLFVLAVMIGGCKYEYPTNINSPISPTADQIAMKINGTTVATDTTEVEKGTVVHFVGESLGPNIVHWEWRIYGFTLTGKVIKYTFTASPPAYALVILRALDVNNITHEISRLVKIVNSVDGQSDVALISSTASGGSYNIVLAFKKAGMNYTTGSNYFYTGNVVSPLWTPVNIATQDTNYNLIAGQLVNPAPSIGKYVKVSLTIIPGAYEMAVGKIVGSQQYWGTFFDSTLVKFTLHSNGTVTFFNNITPTNFPGTIGDEGPEVIVRWEFLSDRVVLYLNNAAAFSGLAGPFVRFQDSTGTWQTPLSQSAVTNFPNWGKREIMYNTLPSNNLLIFNFGSQISQPANFNNSSNKSQYWDKNFMVLKAMIIRSNVGQPRNWIVVRVD